MLIPFLLLTWTNRVSDISPAKMDLVRVSRELQFEVCICGEPSVSPQNSRAGEHFYRGEVVGKALSESKAFHCPCPCQERRGVFLLPVGHCCCCNLMYQTFRGFLLGTTWDYSSTLWWWWLLFVWGDFVLFRASLTLSASQGGVLSQVFSSHSQGQHWEVLWLVHGHITRKWQSLDSNTGRFPNEAHQVQKCFWSNFLKLWKMHTT